MQRERVAGAPQFAKSSIEVAQPRMIATVPGLSTQLCGLGHYNMKAYLEVMSQEDYDSWLKKQAALQ